MAEARTRPTDADVEGYIDEAVLRQLIRIADGRADDPARDD